MADNADERGDSEMAHFFATADDLLPVLLSVEAQYPIKYTPTEYVTEPRVKHFTTARDLPTLFKPQPFGSAIGGPAYLVTESGTEVVLRHVRLNNGSDTWRIDRFLNADSAVIRHGGVYGDSILLPGDVGTIHKTPVAVRLRRAFDEAIRKRFVKIGAYSVGPEAERMLDSGWRLTAAEQSPPQCDLCRSSAESAQVAHARRSLEDTWHFLEADGVPMPRTPEGRPFILERMPSIDDEAPLPFGYFRSRLEEADLSHLTMPRTFFCRSGFTYVNFADTDLSESRMCWNDFDDCDFSGADLTGCDMRSSTFTGCKFVGAVLRGADLRRSFFMDCDFTGADLSGAVAENGDLYTESGHEGVQAFLTIEQQAPMTWTEDAGPEPPGG